MTKKMAPVQIGAGLAIIKKIMECTFFMVYRKPQARLTNLLYWNWCRNRELQTELISDEGITKASKQVWESICKQ
jgi:hypothetical protein